MNKSPFIAEIRLDDFNRRLVGDFWQSCVDLHIDKHQH